MAGEDPLIGAAVQAAVTDALEGIRSVAVCLGGGADSAVLAWAAASSPQPVRAVFVDHGLPASVMLRDAAVALSEQVGLDLAVVAAPVAEGASLEGRARAARVGALEGSRSEGEWLATGHSLDDQAETVLARLLRGAGATGLAAMARRRASA